VNDLRRLLWRFEAHVASADVLRKPYSEKISELLQNKFKNSIEHLIARFPNIAEFGVMFDQAIDEARRYLVAGMYRQCLKEIDRASVILMTFDKAALAFQQIDEVKQVHNELERLIEFGPASTMPSLRLIDMLIAKTDMAFSSGEFRQSLFMARLTKGEIMRLLTIASVNQEIADALDNDIRSVEQFLHKCDCLHRITRKEYIALVVRIRSLLHMQRYILAECLLGDLNVKLSDEVGLIENIEREYGQITDSTGLGIQQALESRGISSSITADVALASLLEQSLSDFRLRMNAVLTIEM
jgi:hypothetical protein